VKTNDLITFGVESVIILGFEISSDLLAERDVISIGFNASV